MTTATTTVPREAVELLGRLTELLLIWSYEGTLRQEEIVKRVGAAYGVDAEVTMLFCVLTPGSHGLRGFESRLGGHPIMGFRGLGDMVELFTVLAVGMLVAGAAVRARDD